ncbi:ParB/RepB/Spo0J family partition protein [Falsigemmobacter intermedius]|uniref:Replication protein n=1 Tax=Falsigemmobacter intermedius TaxID=1553448 RepID=A0A451GGK7_9RHOB|nr:ParB N-terminal domain-containing protein [Falsigemmobacter intermedius]RWY36202.1 replication protein [Falsigemmobacter intermedius]
MKKRRTFGIDLPDEDGLNAFPAGKGVVTPAPAVPTRRSPMAAAITENADSLRDRRAMEEQIRAENDALAAEHVRMKKLGLIVDLVPLDQIETWKLVRDRVKGDDFELAELVTSIRDLGLSNPIRVEMREDGRYELVQGFRRLSAYRQLLAETGDAASWGAIPAGILPRGEDLEGLYRRMVDENLVRKDISFAEMAMLALNYARDPHTSENDPDKAVAQLFQSAGYQKRSYIRQFIRLMERLGEDLQFSQHIPRALGLQLVTALEDNPDLAGEIRARLKGWDNRSVKDELGILRRVLGNSPREAAAGADEDATPAKPATPSGKAKTTFQLPSRLGQAKCTAANGRLEIRLARDFTAIERRRLELALERMLNDLG